MKADLSSAALHLPAVLHRLTQPAVSGLIGDRVKGRLIPTPEAETFYRDEEPSFRGLDRLRSTAARIRDFGSGHIRVASLAAAGSIIVPRAVRKFREEFSSARGRWPAAGFRDGDRRGWFSGRD